MRGPRPPLFRYTSHQLHTQSGRPGCYYPQGCPQPSESMRTFPFLFYTVISFLMVLPPAGGAPFIAEIQAENKDTIKDEDGGASDWVEIFNPDGTAVNLAGFALTDDALLPKKWVFPAITLAA